MVQLPSNPTPATAHAQSDPNEPDWDILSEEWLSDEPELESDLHRDQIDLLLRLMRWYWRDRKDVYVSGNTTVYYDQDQLTTRNFRGPDIYVVFGAEKRDRNSWMVWREGGQYPHVVIELLSNSTATVDRTTKKELYQDVWRLPNYFWFHPYTKEFQGFRLVESEYHAIEPNERGHLWSDQMNLFLGIHEDGTLRLFDADGTLVSSSEEEAWDRERLAQQQVEAERQRTEAERQRAEAERQRAEAERQRAETAEAELARLRDELRSLKRPNQD